MMKTFSTTLILLASLALTACNTTENKVEPAPASPQQNIQPSTAMVGGYNAADVNEEGIQAAAQFAAKALGGTLGKVLQAERQIVAGINYKMKIELQDGTQHDVVVLKDLKGKMHLMQK